MTAICLAVVASVVEEMGAAVFADTGFTCSARISQQDVVKASFWTKYAK